MLFSIKQWIVIFYCGMGMLFILPMFYCFHFLFISKAFFTFYVYTLKNKFITQCALLEKGAPLLSEK